MSNKKQQQKKTSSSDVDNNFIDLTPQWYQDYIAMLDIVDPNRDETFIFDEKEINK
jgi:hypothetical protein